MKRNTIDFENEKISVLFRKLLIPTLLGTISISAMTAIDGILVGHGVGADGVAAVNLIVPIYQIMSGIGLMIGTGCSVMASIHLSQQNVHAARLNITQAIIFTTIFACLICAIVLAFPTHTAILLGSSETLLSQTSGYLLCIMPGFIFQMWSMIGLFIIRLDGSPHYAMWCNIIPATINGILDWVFIFPLGMGVEGAAIATSISLFLGGIMAIIYLLFIAGKLRLVPFEFSGKNILSALRNLGSQCKVGSSTLFGELTLAILIFVGNLVFMNCLGDAGVGAFGIACYYTPFFFMVGNAIAQSAQPIISYNYGISQWKEIKEARRLLLTTSVSIGIVVALLFIFIPHKLVALFVDTASEAGRIAIDGFPYFASGTVFFIFNVAIIGYCQSIKQIRRATVFVFLRGFGFLIPSFIILPKLFGIEGIWLAMPFAEIMTTAIVMIVFLMQRRTYSATNLSV